MRSFSYLLLIIVLFSGISVKAVKKEQVLRNGNFETMSKAGTAEGWRWHPRKSCHFVRTENGNTFVRLVNGDKATSASVTSKEAIALPPGIDSVKVKGRVHVKRIVPGAKSWHDARLALTFKDKDGKGVACGAVAWDRPTNGWVPFEKTFTVKDEAVKLGIAVALFQSEGEIEVDDLEVWLTQLPKDKLCWKLDDAYQVSTATREKISLNGLWKVKLFPELKADETAQKSAGTMADLMNKNKLNDIPWTTLRVPGEWYSSYWKHYTRNECLLPLKGDQGPRAGICGEKRWQGRPLKEYHCAWYEREFVIPADWKPENCYLRFDDFNLAAWIYVNSSRVAFQEGMAGADIPLPAGLKAGDRVILNVLVSAEVDGIEKLVMGGGESYIIRRKKESQTRGIIGDVWLLNQPKNRITDVLLRSSVRKKSLDLLFWQSGSKLSDETLLEVELYRNEDSELVKTWQGPVHKADSNDGRYRVSIPWADPVYWTPEQPYLYRAVIKLKDRTGRVLDEYTPIRFGFREFWIDKGDYYLNGNRIHLRSFGISSAPKAYCQAAFEAYKNVGYNTVYIHPVLQTKPVLEAADEVGMLVIMVIPSVHEYLLTWKTGGKEHWTQKATALIMQVWNHPSIIHWSMSRNMLGYPFDMLPQQIGIENDRSFGPAGKIAVESERIVDGIDGSRPILHHACGSLGQVHSSNIYLNFVPPQEKHEWLLNYRDQRIKPFYAVELGMPYTNTYHYGRKGFGAVLNTEPLHCEYAAMQFGEKAFNDPGKGLLQKVTSAKVLPKASHGADKYVPRIAIRKTDIFLKSQRKAFSFIKDWRACGVGGIHPWAVKLWQTQGWDIKNTAYDSLKTPGIKTRFRYLPRFGKPNLLYDTFQKVMSPLLVYIGGKKEWFTDWRMNYVAGEKISKTVVIVNDTSADVDLPMALKLVAADGRMVDQKAIQAVVDSGDSRMISFFFTAPDVSKKQPYSIVLETINGENKIYDSVPLQVLPRHEPQRALSFKRKLYLLHGSGKSAEMLKEMGISFTPYRGESLGKKDLLIVGRQALPEAAQYCRIISDSLKAGGNMLVFEQTVDDLKKYLGLRAFAASSRRAFTGYGTHDVLPEAGDDDFVNWAGKSTAVSEYPNPGGNSYPVHIWKQGNTGIVSAVTIEKPQAGSYRAILHEGYNLNYTPLLLENIGHGKVIYCQLDVTARTEKEPVAQGLVRQLLTYLDAKPDSLSRAVALTGNEKSAELFDILGVAYRPTEQAQADELWVIDGKGSKRPAGFYENVKRFAANGGDVLVLNSNSPADIGSRLGLSMTDHPMTGYTFKSAKVGELTKGLTAADWYWKDKLDIKLPAKAFPLYQAKLGKGTVTFCQVDPFCFDQSNMNQRRYTLRTKIFRVLANILNAQRVKSKQHSSDYLKGVEATTIDLAGPWQFKLDPDNQGLKHGWNKEAWTDCDKTINAPGCWEKQNVTDFNPQFKNSGMPYDGFAWYQKQVTVGEQFKNQPLVLEIGAIDDCDWIYFNGTLIGKTGKETKGWYAAKRVYHVPAELIRYGKPNLISVRVYDDNREGGIVTGPVKLFSQKSREDFPYLETSDHPRHDPYRFERW